MKMTAAKLMAVMAAALLALPLTARGQRVEAQPRGFVGIIKAIGDRGHDILAGSTGYFPAGRYMGIGPAAEFIGYNTLEHFRLGFGATTTAALSPHVALRGYGAYAFGDRRWKYMGQAEWAISPARGYFGSYRVNSIKATYLFDTYSLGSEFLSPLPRTPQFRLSLRHNEMMLYYRRASLAWDYEPSRTSAVGLAATRERIYPTRFIDFAGLATLDAWRFAAEASWSPGGDFFQTATHRIDTRPYAPRIKARLQWVEGATAADATSLLIAELAAMKVIPLPDSRSTLSLLAHTAWMTGHARYPFLPSLPSPPYIVRELGSFTLLRPLEIRAERYADLHARFDDGGRLTGLIPAIKPLGISVTASLSAAWGEPAGGGVLMPRPWTALSWGKPYVEAGIGLDRLFGMGRIEWVWRLTYRDIPDARLCGLALGFNFAP